MYSYAVYIKSFGSQKGRSSEPPAYGPVKDDIRKRGDMERGEGERGGRERGKGERGEGEEYRRVTNWERGEKGEGEKREREPLNLPIF